MAKGCTGKSRIFLSSSRTSRYLNGLADVTFSQNPAATSRKYRYLHWVTTKDLVNTKLDRREERTYHFQ